MATDRNPIPGGSVLSPVLFGSAGIFAAVALMVVRVDLANAQPALEIEAIGDTSVRVHWPVDSGGFVLEETGALSSSAVWSPSALVPVSEGDRLAVILEASARGRYFRLRRAMPATFRIAGTTPNHGADEVGVTVRPQVFFSEPVDPASLDARNFFATGGGRARPANIVPSADGRFAWLFFHESMPGSTRMTVTVDGDRIRSAAGLPLDANGDGQPGGTFEFDWRTVSLSALPGTSLAGIVLGTGPDMLQRTADDLDPGPDGQPGTADDVHLHPLQGVEVFLLGLEQQKTLTGADGRFRLDDVPSGRVKVAVNGMTAVNAPAGGYYPEIVVEARIMSGIENTVMADGPEFYLPGLANGILHSVDASAGAVLSGDAVTAPELTEEERDRIRIEVPPGSLIGHDGEALSEARIGFSVVPVDFVRTMLPAGVMQSENSFNITLQALGVARFAEPIPVTFPNVDNLPPGTQVHFISFDHDSGLMVIEGTMTVSADGRTLSTDPGTGITHPGWHGSTPPGSPTAGPCFGVVRRGSNGQLLPCHEDDVLYDVDPVPVVQEIDDGQLTDLKDHLFFYGEEDAFVVVIENQAVLPADIPPKAATPMEVTVRLDADAGMFHFGDRPLGRAKPIVERFSLAPGFKQVVELEFAAVSLDTRKAFADGFQNLMEGTRMTVSITKAGDTRKLLDKTVYLYRFLDLLDADEMDRTIQFEQTFADGLLDASFRGKDITLFSKRSNRPTFATSNPEDAVFEVLAPEKRPRRGFPSSRVLFNPVEVRPNQSEFLVVTTPAGAEVGRIRLSGDGTGRQKMFLNPEGLIEALEHLAERSAAMEITLRVLDEQEGLFQLTSGGVDIGPVSSSSTADQIEFALLGLPGIGPDDVSVLRKSSAFRGGLEITFHVSFAGAFAGQPAPPITATAVSGVESIQVVPVSPYRSVLLTESERILFDTVEKRTTLADETIEAIHQSFAAVSNAVDFVDEPLDDAVRVVWTTSSTFGLFGTSRVNPDDDGVDKHRDILVAILRGRASSKARATFELSGAVNQSPGTDVAVHLNNILEMPFTNPLSLTRTNLIGALGKIASHETAHTLGLVHSAVSAFEPVDVESQEVTLQGGTGASTFTMTFDGQTTAPLPRAASDAEVKAALDRLVNVPDNSVAVTRVGSTFLITFEDPTPPPAKPVWVGTDLPELTGAGTDGLTLAVRTIQDGASRRQRLPTRSGEAFVQIDSDEGTDDIMHGSDLGLGTKNQFLEKLGLAALKLGLDLADQASSLNAFEFAFRNFQSGLFAELVESPLDTQPLGTLPGPVLFVVDIDGGPLFNALDFGRVLVDGPGAERAERIVRLFNAGDEPLTVTRIRLDESSVDFAAFAPDFPVELRPAEQIDLTVLFDPIQPGDTVGSLVVHVEPDAQSLAIRLAGSGGTPGPDIFFEVGTVDFGAARVGEAVVEEIGAIVNHGLEPLTITEIGFADEAAEFELVDALDPLRWVTPLVIEPGDTMEVDVRFIPTATGFRRSTLTVRSDDPDTPLLDMPLAGFGLDRDGPSLEGNFVAMETSDLPNAPVLRALTDRDGGFSFFLPPRQAYRFVVFDPVTGLIGEGAGTSAPSGQTTVLPSPPFRVSIAADEDADGLPADVEFAVGTSDQNPDTDGDGLGDADEVRLGSNPLDGQSVRTGMIGRIELGSPVMDVDVEVQVGTERFDEVLAYAVTQDGSLGVVRVTAPERAEILGQSMPVASGEGRVLHFDRIRGLAFIGISLATPRSPTGPGVLDVFDVRDPENPVPIQSISLPHAPAAIASDSRNVYVAYQDFLAVLDPEMLEIHDVLDLGPGPITAVVVGEPDTIFAGTSHGGVIALRFHPTTGQLERLDEVQVDGGGGMQVADGILYAAAARRPVSAAGGFSTVDVADPTRLNVISRADNPGGVRLAGADLARNAGGLLALVGVTGDGARIDVMDSRDPEDTNLFLFSLPLTEIPHVVEFAFGRAFIAGGAAGLLVFNLFSPDRENLPPAIGAPRVFTQSRDPSSTGRRVSPTERVPVHVDILDDVDVVRAELVVNGRFHDADVSAPFAFVYEVPPPDESNPMEVRIQVRAVDAGGNASLSEPMMLDVVPDTSAPFTLRTLPRRDGLARAGDVPITLRFNEPLDASTLSADQFTLQFADDPEPIRAIAIQPVAGGRGVRLDFPALDVAGRYTLTTAPGPRDEADNALADDPPTSFSFEVVTPTVEFIDPNGGNWLDTAKWSTGQVPGPTDRVWADLLPGGDVGIFGGTATVRDLFVARGRLVLNSAATLTIGGLGRSDELAALGGTITGEGRLELRGRASLENLRVNGLQGGTDNFGDVRIAPGLTLAGTVFRNQGTIIQRRVPQTSGSTLPARINLNGNALLHNQSGGRLVVAGQAIAAVGVDNLFKNDGMMLKIPESDTDSDMTLGLPVENTGTIEIVRGPVRVNQSLESTDGLIRIRQGGSLILQGRSQTHTFIGSHRLTGDGRFVFSGLGSQMRVPEGSDLIADLANESFEMSNGSLNVDGLFRNEGLLRWNGGNLAAPGGFRNVGTMSIGGGPSRQLEGVLVNEGFIQHGQAGQITVQNATIQNLAGAIYEITGNAGVNDRSPIDSDFRNEGLLRVTEGATFPGFGLPFMNRGRIELRAGRLITGDLTQSAGSLVLDGGNLQCNGTLDLQGGVLSGAGEVRANVTNNASIEPAGTGSAGRLNVIGGYTQTTAGVLTIELGGTEEGEFDVMTVSSRATLNGILRVKALDGFLPASGQSFRIMTFGSREGDFLAIDGLDLNGVSLTPQYNNRDLTLAAP